MQTSSAAKPAAGRDAFIAEMAEMRNNAAPPPEPAKAKPAPAPDESGLTATPEDDIPTDPLALADGKDDDGEAVAPAAKAAPAKEAKEESVDPAEERRIAASQKQERQWKAKMDADRAALKAERDAWQREQADAKAAHDKEWGPLIKEAQDFKLLKARARYAPIAALRALGYDDMNALYRAAYAETEEGQKNPNARAYVERAMRDREVDDDRGALRKELDELRAERAADKKAREEEQQQARVQQAINSYLDGAQKAVTVEAAPLTAKWMEKAPAKVRDLVHRVAVELAEANGDGNAPPHADVIAEVERRRRAELEEAGVDVAAVLTPAAPRRPTPPPPGRTLMPAGGSPTQPKKKLTDEELREDFVRRRQSGKLEDE